MRCGMHIGQHYERFADFKKLLKETIGWMSAEAGISHEKIRALEERYAAQSREWRRLGFPLRKESEHNKIIKEAVAAWWEKSMHDDLYNENECAP